MVIADRRLTDAQIAAGLGQRVRSLRLRRNRTQEWVKERTGLSLGTVQALESGKGKLETLVVVLRALEGLDSLVTFLPEPLESPIALAQRHGKARQRARSRKSADIPVTKKPSW